MTFSDPENSLPPDFAAPPTPASAPALPLPDENVPEDIRTPWGGGELLIFLGLAIGSLFVMETVLALFYDRAFPYDL